MIIEQARFLKTQDVDTKANNDINNIKVNKTCWQNIHCTGVKWGSESCGLFLDASPRPKIEIGATSGQHEPARGVSTSFQLQTSF
jgi:hypothetical protein